MAVTAVPDAIKEIKELLENQWDNTNTSIGADPHIGYGWFNKRNDEPQITVWPRSDSKLSRGYQYMTSSGGGIERNSDVECNIWTGRYQSPSNTQDTLDDLAVNPRTIAHEFAEEIDRIVISDPFAITEYKWIAPGDLSMVAEPQETSPVQWHYVKIVETRQKNDPL